jgi:hypothetical protein
MTRVTSGLPVIRSDLISVGIYGSPGNHQNIEIWLGNLFQFKR